MLKKIILGIVIGSVILTGATGAIYAYQKNPDNVAARLSNDPKIQESFNSEDCPAEGFGVNNGNGEKQQNGKQNGYDNEGENNFSYKNQNCYQYEKKNGECIENEGCLMEQNTYQYNNRHCYGENNGSNGVGDGNENNQNGKKK